jgi:hypothetical protein
MNRRLFLRDFSILSAFSFLPLHSILAQEGGSPTNWPVVSSGDILAVTSNANALLYAIQNQGSTPSPQAWTSLYDAMSSLFTNMAEGGFNTALQEYTTSIGASYPSGNYPTSSYVGIVCADMNSQSLGARSPQFQTWAGQNQAALSSELTALTQSSGVVACENNILFQLNLLTSSKSLPLTQVRADNSISITSVIAQPEVVAGCARQAILFGALSLVSGEVPPVAAVLGLCALLFDIAAFFDLC